MALTVWDVTGGDVPPPGGTLTVWDVTGTGDLPGIDLPTLTIWDVTGTGPVAVTVVPPAPVVAEPGTTVEVAAALVGGGAADSWTWRVLSGPAVALTGAGPTRRLVVPSVWPPAQALVLGVRATVEGTTSPEATVTVTCLPRLVWARSGNTMVPAPLSTYQHT